MAQTAPYGSWRSPITAGYVAQQTVGLSQLVTDKDHVYWNERRPLEGGRQVIVRKAPGGAVEDLLPAPFSARTLVHEYGGLCYCVHEGTLWFANAEDQRLYRRGPEGDISPLTEAPPVPRATRFADLVCTPDGRFLIGVRERHLGAGDRIEVQNDIVAIRTDDGETTVIAEGRDFYLAPRLSPDGAQLCYLTWNQPDMPWDATELWVIGFNDGRASGERRKVAGGANESVSQPRFLADSSLVYLSDRSGYYNLYRAPDLPLYEIDADCGLPDWVFGQSSFAELDGSKALVVSYLRDGRSHLVLVEDRGATEIEVGFDHIAQLAPLRDRRIVALAGSPTMPLAVREIDLDTALTTSIRQGREELPDRRYLSEPRSITVENHDGQDVHALFYPPRNEEFRGLPGERPPLIVRCHGGPTSSARALFDPEVQFFTSRGFAFVDVDYGGSSGYGRAYRTRLEGRWGELDVEDCTAVASSLAGRGRVDRRRLVVRGSSAGGFIALCCLTFRSLFAAGASYYGVSDLSALVAETHKFEARYVDRLVGPYPASAEVYRARSPLSHLRDLKVPVIFFHGLDDPVVPPEQTEAMVAAMHERGIPAAYLSFEGESHGFRKPETVVRCLEAELYFYGRVLDLEIADAITPVEIRDASLLIH